MKKIRLATLVAVSIVSSPAYGVTLEEVVVTAQKREQSLQDVPLSVAVVSAEALDRRNITDAVSLAQSAPSINFKAGFSPAATNFNIRGIGSYTFEGGIQPSVSFVVDGVPLARSGEFVTELSDIERVEVLRGPQGTLFGRNTTGGAINIATKRPGEEFEGNLEVSFTDDKENLYRASVSGPLSDTVGMSVAGYYKDRDGHIENLYPGQQDVGGIETWGIRTKLDVDFSDDLNVLFIADYREAAFSAFGPNIIAAVEPGITGTLRNTMIGNGDAKLGAQIVDDPFKTSLNGDDPYDEALENYGFSADVTFHINDNITLKAISAYRDWHTETDPDIEGPGQVANGGFGLPFTTESNLSRAPNKIQRHYDSDWFSQEIRLEGSYDSVDWIAGVYYQDYEETVNGSFEVVVPFRADASPGFYSGTLNINSDELLAYSGFFDVTFHLTDTVDVFGGFRWSVEEVDASFDTVFYALPLDAEGLVTQNAATNSVFIDRSLLDPERLMPLLDAVNASRMARDLDPLDFKGAAAPIVPVLGSDDETSEDWSGRLGVSWQLNEDVNLYSSVSRGFIGAGVDIGRFGSPGHFLEPVIAEAFEVGIKSQLFDNRVQLNAAAFVQKVTDIQAASLIASATTVATVTQNAGDLDITGFEADVVWAVSDTVRLSAGLAYIDAEVDDLLQQCWRTGGQTVAKGCNITNLGMPTTTEPGTMIPDPMDSTRMIPDPNAATQTDVSGSQAPNTPEWKYNISLDVDVPLPSEPFDGYVNISYVWQDDAHFSLDNDPVRSQDDYGLLDIALGIIDKEGRYEFSIFGKNVTDEFFIGDSESTPGFIAQQYNRVSRGARAYYGAKLKYNFY